MNLLVEVDWRYGVNPFLVQDIEHRMLKQGFTEEHIKVISENEIVILNNPK